MKEKLLKIKEKLLYKKSIENFETDDMENYSKTKQMDNQDNLDKNIHSFLNWYRQFLLDNDIFLSDLDDTIKNMENLIDKMAIWYELRYPDYEIGKLLPYGNTERQDINKTMFENNSYIKDLLYDDEDVKCLEWADFYNKEAFIKSLPNREKRYFSNPKYPSIVYWNVNQISAHLHLSADGFVEYSEFMSFVDPNILDQELTGKHIKEVVELLKEMKIEFPIENEFEKAIKNYHDKIYLKEELLHCVMYKIIQRGQNRIGPRRAFLFAKEFDINIDIPMIYGIDYSDLNLKIFINEYIKAGGTKDLACYVNYFCSDSDNLEKIITIETLLKSINYSNDSFYKPEVDYLHKRLVDILNSQIDQDEKVKQLRIQRKLEKSKQNKL